LSTSFSLALYLLALLLLLLLPSSFHPGRRILFALVLAPPGTYLRYLLSRYLNPLSKSFPVLGTLAANLLATTVLSVCFLLQRLEGFGGSATTLVQCQTMQAFEDGFCGCLSTVSTFVSELDSLSNAPPKAVSNGAAAGREDEKGGKGGEEGETVREWFREGGTWRAWAYFGMSVFLGVAIVVLVVGSGRWAKSGGLGAACRY
jgi:fluoride ion exporter CrcB/FEX